MARLKRKPPQHGSSGRPVRAKAAPSHQAPGSSARNIRETIESIVIAFVLAFLFRTFEAEAFVIPTGSMAPTLQGMHKDVECPQCDARYQASASIEAEDEIERNRLELQQVETELRRIESAPNRVAFYREEAALRSRTDGLRHRAAYDQVVTATCPMCRYTMSVVERPTYNGDRILVNKLLYDVKAPRRWEVVVFKFPGDAKMNYIKRLVGLPGETVRIDQGDLFIKAPDGNEFHIARKSPRLTKATLQDVHDTQYQPAFLAERNWPSRWQVWPPDGRDRTGGWLVGTAVGAAARDVAQTFRIAGATPGTHWIRYQHLVPSAQDWDALEGGPLTPDQVAQIRPQLITDFCAYNTWTTRDQAHYHMPPRGGLHWVGDLMVVADVVVRAARGHLLLDLVEGGKHFQCDIDLATAAATLTIQGLDDFAARGSTPLGGPGHYRLGFANVNDQLFLWVNRSPVQFDRPTTYDASAVFGDRHQIRPRSSSEDAGDLAPVGVGAQEANLEINRLQVLRDVYYIADQSGAGGQPISDYDGKGREMAGRTQEGLARLLSDPTAWDVFTQRRHADFPLADDQFFVLGDNSAFSKDGRLWPLEQFGHYVERQLLIGKAMFVYWPHSWNRIPGTSIPLPYFPNFADMKVVR